MYGARESEGVALTTIFRFSCLVEEPVPWSVLAREYWVIRTFRFVFSFAEYSETEGSEVLLSSGYIVRHWFGFVCYTSWTVPGMGIAAVSFSDHPA